MSAASQQAQSFGDISLSGNGHTLTINQTIQAVPAVVNQRVFVEESPYLGLRHFAQEHAHLFFGRAGLVSELLDATIRQPFTLIVGASGSGKSSVVRAGLLPQLQQRLPKLKVFTLVPDSDPFDSLRAALLQNSYSRAKADAALTRQPDTLLQVCGEAGLRLPGEPWLVFIDQLEQIFSRTADPDLRFSLLDGIVRFAAVAPPEVRLIATLRADYFDRLDPYQGFLKLIEGCLKTVPSPEAEDLRECITQPAAHHGVLFEAGLVDVYNANYSENGERILTASADQTARLWDAETGSQIAALQGHSDRVLHASFSTDGRCLLTASADGTARLWDAERSKAFTVLEGHTNAVFEASFSGDDSRVLTASAHGPVQIWNPQTAMPTAALHGHAAMVSDASFSADGCRVLTASVDGTARV